MEGKHRLPVTRANIVWGRYIRREQMSFKGVIYRAVEIKRVSWKRHKWGTVRSRAHNKQFHFFFKIMCLTISDRYMVSIVFSVGSQSLVPSMKPLNATLEKYGLSSLVVARRECVCREVLRTLTEDYLLLDYFTSIRVGVIWYSMF